MKWPIALMLNWKIVSGTTGASAMPEMSATVSEHIKVDICNSGLKYKGPSKIRDIINMKLAAYRFTAELIQDMVSIPAIKSMTGRVRIMKYFIFCRVSQTPSQQRLSSADKVPQSTCDTKWIASLLVIRKKTNLPTLVKNTYQIVNRYFEQITSLSSFEFQWIFQWISNGSCIC